MSNGVVIERPEQMITPGHGIPIVRVAEAH